MIAQRELFSARSIADRTVYDGRGEGGDRSLEIDRRAEDIVFAELEACTPIGHSFTAISEERGDGRVRRRQRRHPGRDRPDRRLAQRPADPAVALPQHRRRLRADDGDVEFGYVYDFGAGEEFVARAGGGSTLDDQPLRAEGPGYGLEVVGLEAAKPERILPMISELEGKAYRIRAIGSIAITLCYVAAGRLDGMLTAAAAARWTPPRPS